MSSSLQKVTKNHTKPRRQFIRKVEPIRSKKVIRDTLEVLAKDKSAAGDRRYLMFATGIYLGRRVGDMLKMKVRDVYDRDNFEIIEEKTGKPMYLAINSALREIYQDRLKGRGLDEPLFLSTRRNRITGEKQAINKRTALRDIKIIGRIAKLPEGYRIGTHTMRKTFGYWYYRNYGDVAMLMEMFNHSKAEVTLIYIGITDDEMRKAFKKTKDMYDD